MKKCLIVLMLTLVAILSVISSASAASTEVRPTAMPGSVRPMAAHEVRPY